MDRVPVLELDGVLLASIQTELTDATVVALQEDLLDRAAATGAGGVVIDVSAVEVIDSYLARVLTEITLAVRMLAARTVVAGMRPAVAVTLVEMGLDLPGVETARSPAHALEMLARR
ncbi:STAS domain-containing protein [Actinomadura kijaniata]|uniref:STAS domain-containing protein n=1 Tax=Actinomadura kijaniata TaxID=46161 RepID=UPI003F1C3BE3